MKKHAFTITELLVSLVIVSILGLGGFSAFRFYNFTASRALHRTMAFKELRTGVDQMKNDILMSIRIFSNGTPNAAQPSLGTHKTYEHQLIVELPSMNSSGNFIDENGVSVSKATNACIDYLRFYVSNGELVEASYVGTIDPFDSVRYFGSTTVNKRVLAKNIKSVEFSCGSFPFAATIADIDSTFNSKLKSLRLIRIKLIAEYEDPITHDISEIIIQEQVALRNYYFL